MPGDSRDGDSTPDVADVFDFVADRIRHESAVAEGGADPLVARKAIGEPQLIDPTGYKGQWRVRFARLRLRASYRTARSRAKVLRWRRRMNATAAGRIGVKLAVAAIGTLVIAIGVILLPLPGPGWVIVFAGLAILALEFHWARRLLTFGRTQLRRWTQTVRGGSWTLRVASVLALLAVVAVAAWISVRVAFGVDLADKLLGG